jgi:essential nuclear protein 1
LLTGFDFDLRRVGVLLSRYKSGPLPRALKILPSLPHWAQLLALTQPPAWTPHATYACTKIFVSNLKPTEVQVFLEGILLEKVRDNMMDGESRKGGKGGKLDVQLYEALKKGLYKPAAWFKGILFPLCEVSREYMNNDDEKRWSNVPHHGSVVTISIIPLLCREDAP